MSSARIPIDTPVSPKNSRSTQSKQGTNDNAILTDILIASMSSNEHSPIVREPQGNSDVASPPEYHEPGPTSKDTKVDINFHSGRTEETQSLQAIDANSSPTMLHSASIIASKKCKHGKEMKPEPPITTKKQKHWEEQELDPPLNTRKRNHEESKETPDNVQQEILPKKFKGANTTVRKGHDDVVSTEPKILLRARENVFSTDNAELCKRMDREQRDLARKPSKMTETLQKSLKVAREASRVSKNQRPLMRKVSTGAALPNLYNPLEQKLLRQDTSKVSFSQREQTPTSVKVWKDDKDATITWKLIPKSTPRIRHRGSLIDISNLLLHPYDHPDILIKKNPNDKKFWLVKLEDVTDEELTARRKSQSDDIKKANAKKARVDKVTKKAGADKVTKKARADKVAEKARVHKVVKKRNR